MSHLLLLWLLVQQAAPPGVIKAAMVKTNVKANQKPPESGKGEKQRGENEQVNVGG